MPGEGRGLSSRPTQDVVRDLEIGQPSNSEKRSDTADGVTRQRRDVLSESRMREICMSGCVSSEGWHVQQEQTCRGRSQSPVVWIAEEMETEPSKPIDKTSRGEVTSHRAVTTVNALWPRK